MDIEHQDLQQLKQQEHEFLTLVENCSRSELAKSAKFLAMYLALYRQQFGEIPAADYIKLVQAPTLDKGLLQLVSDGMQEASAMMKMVMLQDRQAVNEGDDNLLN